MPNVQKYLIQIEHQASGPSDSMKGLFVGSYMKDYARENNSPNILLESDHTLLNANSSDILTLSYSTTVPPPVQMPDFMNWPHISSVNKTHWNPHHILYMKTHKTGSSTIFSLLTRYGLKHNLTFALPKNVSNSLGWPKPFSRRRDMRPIKKDKPDILYYHSVLSESMLRTMPRDSFYFTSLREPYSQLKSSYSYYNLDHCEGLSKRLVSAPANLAINNVTECRRVVVKNSQMYDLGMPFDLMDDEEIVNRTILALDKLLHFVMVLDYFDESLILLRDLLGMSTQDILYFKSNFRSPTVTKLTDNAVQLNATTYKSVQRWLRADYLLYNHFKTKLEHMMKDHRSYLDKEIAKLKASQDVWMRHCVLQRLPGMEINDTRFQPYGEGTYGYELTEEGLQNKTCIEFAAVELYNVCMLSKTQSYGMTEEVLKNSKTTKKPNKVAMLC